MDTNYLAQEIANIINEGDFADGMQAAVNPISAYAPSNYTMTAPDGVILVYLDYISGFEYGKQLLDRRYPILTSACRFVVSVGVKDVNRLDGYCNLITDRLCYQTLSEEAKELLPAGWSKMSKSEDAYWRQIWFAVDIRRSLI